MTSVTGKDTGAPPLTLAEAASFLGPFLFPSSGAAGVVLAVSGGPDSVALMRLAARLGATCPLVPVVVGTVDHQLRPRSAQEAEEVRAWAEDCGLPHRALGWDEPKPRTGLQEAAREARYRLLAGLARDIGASHVLTAHTLDDQAETVLMRLTRGTGVAGLGGMREVSERHGVILARPFLVVRKARLVATCQEEGWPYFEDPSNTDLQFERTRWRRIMPLLEAEGLTAERLAAVARRAQSAEDALMARAGQVMEAARLSTGPGLALDARTLAAEPDAILLRAIACAIVAVAGSQARRLRLERLERRVLGDLRGALARGVSLGFTLGGAVVRLRGDGRLVLSPEPPRRRGRASSINRVAAAPPHSLGKAPDDA